MVKHAILATPVSQDHHSLTALEVFDDFDEKLLLVWRKLKPHEMFGEEEDELEVGEKSETLLNDFEGLPINDQKEPPVAFSLLLRKGFRGRPLFEYLAQDALVFLEYFLEEVLPSLLIPKTHLDFHESLRLKRGE